MLKKVFALIMVIVLCLSVGACQRTVTEQPDGGTNQTENTEHTENTESTGNTESSENISGNPGLTLFRFLDDTNSNGQITPIEEQEAPGDMPEMWRIPQPDQSRIGETVPIVLAKWHRAIPFYYSCTEDGTERLAVFLSADKIPMLMVFETQLGGVAELYKKISTGAEFQGKILAMVNISWEEGNQYAKNVCIPTEDIPVTELLTDGTTLVAGECLGIVGETTFKHDKINMVVKGGVYENASQGLRNDIDWMKQKFARCGITDIMSPK